MKTAEMNNWIQVTDGVTTGWIPKSKIKGNDQTDVDASPINTSDIENTTVVEDKTNTLANTSTNTNTAKNTSVANNTTNTNKTNTTVQNKVEDNKIETSTNKIGVVNVETAKVRASADPKGKVLGLLDLDDKITITAESGEWYKFTASDISGYVNKKLITIKSEGVSSRGTVEDREEYKENITVEEKKEEKKEATLEASNSSNSINPLEFRNSSCKSSTSSILSLDIGLFIDLLVSSMKVIISSSDTIGSSIMNLL